MILCKEIHLNQTMKIIQLHIYLFMLCQTTGSLTDTRVTLGADMTLTCDLDIKEIYWYRQKLLDPPVLILHTFSSKYEGGNLENSSLSHKYSVKTNSRLSIRNISTDELGVYYCVKTSEPLKFSNGTRIYLSDSGHKNQSSVLDSLNVSRHQASWRNTVIITSVLTSAFILIAVIGLVKTYRSNSEDMNEPQFAETVLLKHLSGSRSCQTECSFSLLHSNTDEGAVYRRVREV